MRKSQFVTSIQCQLVEKPLIFTQLGQFRTSIHPNIRTTALGTKRRETKVSLFFCFLAWRRALCARVQCVCSLPSKLAITPPLPSKLRFILRHKFITSAAVLTLICGCANREVFIARPLGLRHIGVRASALHFDPGSGY